MKTYKQYAEEAWPGLKVQARRRKRINRAKKAAVICPVILLAIVIFQSLSSPKQPEPQLAQTPPQIATVPAPEFRVSDAPALPAKTHLNFILSDEEALDKLADLGPIFVQFADGTKKIFLTRPNNISSPGAGKF